MSATASRARSSAPRRTAPRGAPAVPRRVSGPAGGRVRVQQRPQQSVTAGARALALVRSLPDHSLIDRLVRGRAWIPVLGVLLVGIVAMQVEILKAGTSLGRSLERTASLQSQNESLQAGVAGLDDYQRIERLATGMGMEMPSPSLLTFVASHPHAQTGSGLVNLHAPDPTGFATQLAADVATAEQMAPSGTQSTVAPGSASSSATSTGTTTSATSPATSTTAATPGTGSVGADSSAAGSAGTAATLPQTTGADSTAGAPTSTVTPAAGAGASPGAGAAPGAGASPGGAGLPTTPSSQSGSSSGG
jgi:cell division protein FtsL